MVFEEAAKLLFLLEIVLRMKVLVIDDEVKARSLLKNLIFSASEEVEEVYEAADLKSGVELIRQKDPRLVFLDIEMPEEQGTDIFNYFDKEEIKFELVFTTAYSEYALQAFEMNAIDYLLKPIRPKRLKEVIHRVLENFNQEGIQKRLEELKNSLRTNNFQKIGLPVNDGFEFVELKDIMHLEADGMYTKVIISTNNETILVSKPLKFFQDILGLGNTFYRPHRSHIVNLSYLKRYVRSNGNHIVLENGNIVPVAKDKRAEFLELVTTLMQAN